MAGWAEGPGGSELARLIAEAFARAAKSDTEDTEGSESGE